jgi:formylglycine-generating enzyme required for sulfatase activity
MGGNPSHHKGPQNPVEMVSLDECEDFCSKLRDLFPGTIFRFSTEEEWEYACRAGTTGSTYAESLGCGIDDIAWYSKNSDNQTHPVKQKIPNPWGLYDMLGNVSEWCSSGEGDNRIIRGGSWDNDARYVRTAYRQNVYGTRGEDLGLRLVIRS